MKWVIQVSSAQQIFPAAIKRVCLGVDADLRRGRDGHFYGVFTVG